MFQHPSYYQVMERAYGIEVGISQPVMKMYDGNRPDLFAVFSEIFYMDGEVSAEVFVVQLHNGFVG